jgi:hypothetical protein
MRQQMKSRHLQYSAATAAKTVMTITTTAVTVTSNLFKTRDKANLKIIAIADKVEILAELGSNNSNNNNSSSNDNNSKNVCCCHKT